MKNIFNNKYFEHVFKAILVGGITFIIVLLVKVRDEELYVIPNKLNNMENKIKKLDNKIIHFDSLAKEREKYNNTIFSKTIDILNTKIDNIEKNTNNILIELRLLKYNKFFGSHKLYHYDSTTVCKK